MTPAARHLSVNARFLTRPATGVDRVAIELLVALARRPDVARLDLLHPAGRALHADWVLALPGDLRSRFHLLPLGRRQGHLWEQLDLARAQPDRLLLSLCSTGPALRQRQAVMIHDAQVWDAPDSFSRGFRLAYRALLPVVARRAQHVLTVSEFARRRLQDLGIAPQGKPRVILNGADHILRVAADPAALTRHGLVPGGYFFAIGNLAPHKNLARLAEAAALREKGAPELIVAGGMNARVFASAGLQDRPGVRFIGRITDPELRALYEGAQALVFPSLTEGFGLPPVEAMFCGCPVLATSGGAVPEICGDAALYVDPRDLAGWTRGLQRLAADPALRDRMSGLGRVRAARYTWAAAAERLMQVLASQGG